MSDLSTTPRSYRFGTLLRERYFDYMALAIRRRNASREKGISPALRRMRLESMRFWACLAVKLAQECGAYPPKLTSA